MSIHISARLVWHDSGWNGSICWDPKANSYCVGQHSFPGDTIAKHRALDWEGADDLRGRPICTLGRTPPCIMSVNAFGADGLEAFNAPPKWFRDQTDVKKWQLPPYTIATWPCEEVYRPEGRRPPGWSMKRTRSKRFTNSAANG